MLSWDDDTILMAYNNTPVADWHERSPLTLACSHDEGRTWHNLLDLAPAPGNKCQPAMCKGSDGRLHVIYMHRHTAIDIWWWRWNGREGSFLRNPTWQGRCFCSAKRRGEAPQIRSVVPDVERKKHDSSAGRRSTEACCRHLIVLTEGG